MADHDGDAASAVATTINSDVTTPSLQTHLLPLAFQREIITEILADDSALVVLARGLGPLPLIQFLARAFARPISLVFILDAGNSGAPNATLLGDLDTADTLGDPTRHAHIVTGETAADQRQQAYLRGGVFLITARVLVVDILSDKVPLHLVTGIIIHRADRVAESSTEAFILRLFRAQNQNGFIRAFSETPESLVGGFNKLEKSLRALHVRKVLAWPRFHMLVAQTLAAHPADTVELHVNLTESMQVAQLSIMELITMCIAELRRLLHLEFTTLDGAVPDTDPDPPAAGGQDWAMEAAGAGSKVRRRRARATARQSSANLTEAYVAHGEFAIGVTHRPPPGSRARYLLADLALLKSLLGYLTDYDAVAFLTFLETFYTACTPGSVFSTRESPWLLTDAAATLMSVARTRVYEAVPAGTSATDGDGGQLMARIETALGIKPTLEVLPKWHALREVLDEIRALHQERHPDGDVEAPRPRARTLILCKEPKTARQLAQYLVQGDQVLTSAYLKYLDWKGKLRNIKLDASKESAAGAGTAATLPAPGMAGAAAAASAKKRRRVRGGAVAAAAASNAVGADDPLAEAVASAERLMSAKDPTATDTDAPGDGDGDANDSTAAASPDVIETVDLDISIRVMGSALDESLIPTAQPDYIVMYDPDPGFIRRIEMYHALHPDLEVRTYFLSYKDSVEEQTYLARIRREKEAFERVIKQAAAAVVPLDVPAAPPATSIATSADDPYAVTAAAATAARSLFTTGPSSMRHGGAMGERALQEKVVVVDMREFRAALPAALHARGMRVVPTTLEVGDYVLARDVVVERKSLTDLVQSLNSGRLYYQAEAMCRYYPVAALLIEFDGAAQMSLFQQSAMSDAAPLVGGQSLFTSGQESLPAKLTLLTLHFPKLKLLWSTSPTASAELLDDMKRGRDEPDPKVAAVVGLDGAPTGAQFHTTPHDLVRSLPGVAHGIDRRVMHAYTSVYDLVQQCKQNGHVENRLAKVVGGTGEARAVVQFVKHDPKTGAVGKKGK
ncbi:DNA repair protein (rad1) [Allomyces macrogynus ATCC 38327]|uniref:DNA repair protein (Rad1) n=1 Tax=Allomyces macrogynus (strain ATCC 38327) TaxID=578462 RepID=A0A0L0SJ08_ALLM3|nr:DNA repair protein (rad1) [Allomyces macrogynus ATCC 38327]|eukprot:KNE62471.1 DNA repair protein (rad1) [Allomyces macrogynus ATCC 38327]